MELTDEEVRTRTFRSSLYRVLKEFYEIKQELFLKIVADSEKILSHEILDVLRTVCNDKDE